MNAWRSQLEAIGSALLIIQNLPEGTVWSLTCTNDDDAESPSVLNIYVGSREWPALQGRLKLGKPVDRSKVRTEQWLSFKQGTLHIDFIETEES